MAPPYLSLLRAVSADHFNRVRVLISEYRESTNAPICFSSFQEELAGLPGHYAEPAGCILIADVAGCDAGCVAVRPLEGDPFAAELKRLYVRAPFRGTGIGRRLVTTAFDFARAAGYRRIQLDTLNSMQAAQRLYSAMGFQILPSPDSRASTHPFLMELKL